MSIGPFVWLILLLIANGFFVAAEFAYITARRSVLEQKSGGSARMAVRLTKELSLSLTAAQLGITMASLGLGAVAEPAVAHLLEEALGLTGLPDAVIHAIALTIALVIVVFLHMVIGEMAPKNVAISRPEGSAVALARPFRAFIIVFRPLIATLNAVANGVLRLFRVKPADSLAEGHTADELAVIIATGQEEGVIEGLTHRLLTGAILFGDLDSVDVMVPRPDVIAAPIDVELGHLERLMMSTGHSRIPVYGENLDDVKGLVHVKDMMNLPDDQHGHPLDESSIREVLFVPESAHVGSVLAQMRGTRNHFAVVVDEHGSTAGILTMEDIVEELVGEIRDEYDSRTRAPIETERGTFLVPGQVRPDQLTEYGITLPDGEYETIGGLVMTSLGRMPRRGDVVDAPGWTVRVTAVEGRRVREVELSPVTPDSETNDGQSPEDS